MGKLQKLDNSEPMRSTVYLKKSWHTCVVGHKSIFVSLWRRSLRDLEERLRDGEELRELLG